MLNEEQIEELRALHKRIAVVQGKDDAWFVVFRKPTRAEFKRFRSMLHNEEQKSDAQESLARSCAVYASGGGFDALLEDFPAIPEACGKALGELAGFAVNQSAKT